MNITGEHNYICIHFVRLKRGELQMEVAEDVNAHTL